MGDRITDGVFNLLERYMSRINVNVSPDAASAEMLNAIESKLGSVPNIFKIMSHSSATLSGYLGFSSGLSKGKINTKDKERIALLVGRLNACDYCVAAHTAMAKRAGLSDSEIKNAINGKGASDKENTLFSFCTRMIKSNGHIDDGLLFDMRRVEFSDAEIIEITGHICLNIFTNYFNHITQPNIDFPK
jgi:AhpD family alkylhydroperoxidase